MTLVEQIDADIADVMAQDDVIEASKARLAKIRAAVADLNETEVGYIVGAFQKQVAAVTETMVAAEVLPEAAVAIAEKIAPELVGDAEELVEEYPTVTFTDAPAAEVNVAPEIL